MVSLFHFLTDSWKTSHWNRMGHFSGGYAASGLFIP